jgi:rubrerythrin
MLRHLRAAMSGPDPETRYECRRCGHTLDNMHIRCPECQATDIASYQL